MNKPRWLKSPELNKERGGGGDLRDGSGMPCTSSKLEPPFSIGWGPLPTDSSIREFDNGRVGCMANSVKQGLLLPGDMVELCNLEKHEMFLSLKRDLALVRFSSSFLPLFTSKMFSF